jgi:rare lipoprotein A (peptidoglycan hydrolase)
MYIKILIFLLPTLLSAQTVQQRRVHVLRMGENLETVLIRKQVDKAVFCTLNDCNRTFVAGDILELGTQMVERKLPPYQKPVYTPEIRVAGNEMLGQIYQSGYVSIFDETTILKMANGEKYNPNAYIIAHPELPFGTRLLISNTTNGKQVYAVVKDRGPLESGSFIEISEAIAVALELEEDLYPIVEIRLVEQHEE